MPIPLSTSSQASKKTSSMAAIFKYKLHSLGPVLTTLCTLLLHCGPQTYTDSKHYLLFPNWSEFLWKIIAADESWVSERIQWKSLEFPSLTEARWVWNKTQRMLIIFSAFIELCTNNWFLGVRLSTQSFTVLSWGIWGKHSEEMVWTVVHVSVPLCASTEHIENAGVLWTYHTIFAHRLPLLSIFTLPWFHPLLEI